MTASNSNDTATTDRRETDRRQKRVPIDFPDRRKGARRSGTDRRASPRS